MSEQLRSGVQSEDELLPAGYYSFEGMPVEITKGGWPQFVSADGQRNVKDISHFMHNGRPITKEEFDRLVRGTARAADLE